MENNIKWIFMDIGSTLVDERDCEDYRINKTLKQDNSPGKTTFINSMIKYANDNKNAYKCTILEYGLKKATWNSEKEVLYPNVENVLKSLSKKYKLGIIANQNFGLVDRLKDFGILDYFEMIISSSEVGVSKPDVRIFKLALYKSNCIPCETIMIGDRIDNDILPAQEAGMKTIWIRQGYGGKGNPEILNKKPDYIIDSFDEIIRIIKL